MNNHSVQHSLDVIRSSKPWKMNEKSLFSHQYILPNATLAPWNADIEFQEIYQRIKDFTLVDIYRCYELWTLGKQCELLEGDILEVGVWRGGTGALLAHSVRANTTKTVFLADTFTGVVKTSKVDPSYHGGEHNDTSVEIVENLCKSIELRNVNILTGIFPEQTGHSISGKIALLHCDVDVYQSAKDTVEWAIPRLSIGSMIVFDDYGFSSCEGISIYCEELRKNKNFRFIHNINGHAIFVKIL